MARALCAVNRTLSGVPPSTFNLKMKGYCKVSQQKTKVFKNFSKNLLCYKKSILKDEVLLTVSSPIVPSILIAKNLLTGSFKNRSIDNLETQKEIYFNGKFPIL